MDSVPSYFTNICVCLDNLRVYFVCHVRPCVFNIYHNASPVLNSSVLYCILIQRAGDPTQVSEDGSESDVEEGDFTVYECPGLAEAEQLEVQNPLFEGGESIAPGLSTNGSCGEIVNPSDLDDGSDSTPTVKTTGQL
ncbi:uncharacterized protein DEA37_0002955 [Paragonimus westermani]|uniref:Neural proliferation differentiation and control protein 1 n=1 Tax=Paragonimus westermani TaxID=34504 RepID=A0A5J4NVL2_9TREM|nr:uncharacterized protein DEA37_0002955 [Paragonimus westermani]